MQSLRHAKHISSLVLVWFVLSIGVAVAAPLMQTQNAFMVCSSNGMYQIMLDGDEYNDPGATGRLNPKLKCPLCLLLDAPPNLLSNVCKMAFPPIANTLEDSETTVPVAGQCAAPLPARGPPGTAFVCPINFHFFI